MEVIEEIKNIVKKLDEIDNYNSSLNERLSVLDSKQQDLLHFIENNKINILWCYKLVKEIKNVREERRKVKNDMDMLSKYNEQKNKLLSKDNRQFLLAELHKREKTQGRKYSNKQYTQEELNNLLGGG